MKTIKKIDKSRLIALKGEKILVLEKRGLKRQYTLAGGIRKKKETDKGSLIRETSEEIGQLLNKRDLSYFISRKTTNKAEKEIYKHYFITTKNIENIEVQEPHKFKSAQWIYWYEAVEYLDKEDRKAVELFFDTFKRKSQ